MKLDGIIIYPTESSYAIGCAYNNRSAIRTIMKLKGRQDDRFTVVASSLAQVQKHFKLNKAQLVLAKKYWPGALSIVISKKLAIRVPKQPIAQALAKIIGKPLIASSVNISGEPAIFDLRKLPKRFQDIPAIDVGPLPKQLPSTVVEYKKGKLIIHRAGPVEPDCNLAK